MDLIGNISSDDEDVGPQPLPDVHEEVKTIDNEKKASKLEEASKKNRNQNLSENQTAEKVIQKRKIPISHQIDLSGHTKAVSCVSVEPSGSRVVTGSLDYTLQVYDFGGMDNRHKAFKSITGTEEIGEEIEEDNHMIVSIDHSPNGDKFVVGTGSCQPIAYDREGKKLFRFVRGDMYLRDLTNTNGHTMEVTAIKWHPYEKNIVYSSSLDGTVRIWDLTGEASFGCLLNKAVLRIRGPTGGIQRIGATSCTVTPNAGRIIAGATDGTIHLWQHRRVYSKADHVLRYELCDGHSITALVASPDNTLLAAKYNNGMILVWNIEGMITTKQPFRMYPGIHNDYTMATLDFSPDGSLLICGTSPVNKEDSEEKSKLLIFDVKSESLGPMLQIGVEAGASVIGVKWQAATNHIYCTLSSGNTRVYYDPTMSKKGALLSSIKAPKRVGQHEDVVLLDEIENPDALPMYAYDPKKEFWQKRAILKDPKVTKIPEQRPTKGPGTQLNTSFFFTQYVMSGRKADTSRMEDPREALLKVDEATKNDPKYFGKAYAQSQPKSKLHSMTFEQEQEEFKKKQKRSIEN